MTVAVTEASAPGLLQRARGVRRRLTVELVFVVAVGIAFLALEVVPIAAAIVLSFERSGPFTPRASWAGTSQYAAVLADPVFWRALRNGATYALACTALQLPLGVGAALALHAWGSTLSTSLALLPYLIPTVSVTLAWSWILNGLYGILNHALVGLGLARHPIFFLQDPRWAMPAVVAVSVWQFTPFVILVTLANLQTIPSHLYEAARIDGAGAFGQLWHVTLPLLRAPILLVLLLRSVWMFNRFDVIWLLTGGGPLHATTTLPVYAYVQTFENGSYGLGAAVSTVIFLLLVAFGVAYFQLVRPHEEVVRHA